MGILINISQPIPYSFGFIISAGSGRVCAACGRVYITVAGRRHYPQLPDIAGSLISGHGQLN